MAIGVLALSVANLSNSIFTYTVTTVTFLLALSSVVTPNSLMGSSVSSVIGNALYSYMITGTSHRTIMFDHILNFLYSILVSFLFNPGG